jgi:hypothetical protein
MATGLTCKRASIQDALFTIRNALRAMRFEFCFNMLFYNKRCPTGNLMRVTLAVTPTLLQKISRRRYFSNSVTSFTTFSGVNPNFSSRTL